MRYFNTSGPCDPERHYTLFRPPLLAKGQRLVEQGRYFTLFAPRQTGKTTYFQLLFRQLQTQGYLPIWISFEGLKNASPPKFYRTMQQYLQREFALAGIPAAESAALVVEDNIDLQFYLAPISTQSPPIVLVIDEFEDIPTTVMSELLHTLRALYQKRQFHKLHALILVGVSTMAELVVSSASPFNIVDQLELPYFSFDEVQALIDQYVSEAGQPFDPAVVKAIYDNTRGQPGRVSALCQYRVEEIVTDRGQPVRMAAFYPTLKHFLTERKDKNLFNIVQKAKEKPAFMLRLLFNETPLPFSIDNPDMAYLAAHGVIENVGGNVEILAPLYAKRLITAFRPTINGETGDYQTGFQDLSAYVTGNRLNINALLQDYRAYVQRCGFHAFDTEHLKEGAWHYSLDGFLHFFIQRLGGDTLVEVPSGRGRTDILILYKGSKEIIETKVYLDQGYFDQGKTQLVDYLLSEGLEQGYYVVFSNKHGANDPLYSEETIQGKRLYTWLIRTAFQAPSRRVAKKLRKRKDVG
jgi:hypothetical protein